MHRGFGDLHDSLGWPYAASCGATRCVVRRDRPGEAARVPVFDPSGSVADSAASRSRRSASVWPQWRRASNPSTPTSTPARANRCTTTPARALTPRRSSATATDVAAAEVGRRCEWCEAHAGVTPFHTDVDTSPDEPVFHDLVGCPYGQAITRDGHDMAGTGGRRRCEWCDAHRQRQGPARRVTEEKST